jgi:hypothetical protein
MWVGIARRWPWPVCYNALKKRGWVHVRYGL